MKKSLTNRIGCCHIVSVRAFWPALYSKRNSSWGWSGLAIRHWPTMPRFPKRPTACRYGEGISGHALSYTDGTSAVLWKRGSTIGIYPVDRTRQNASRKRIEFSWRANRDDLKATESRTTAAVGKIDGNSLVCWFSRWTVLLFTFKPQQCSGKVWK